VIDEAISNVKAQSSNPKSKWLQQNSFDIDSFAIHLAFGF
jgi:hypothetical protein